MKKILSQEEMLEKAEGFFKKKNYRLAKEFFESVFASLSDKKIIEKIEICTTELNKDRSKVVLKKVKKLLKKKKIKEAISTYEEAYNLIKEDWILEKINKLKGGQESENNISNAEQEEKSENFAQAAKLYEDIFKSKKQYDYLIRLCMNLVLSKKIPDAEKYFNENNSLFEEKQTFSNTENYELGFLYVKFANYAKSYAHWELVTTENAQFAEQKDTLLKLWEEKLYNTKSFTPAILEETRKVYDITKSKSMESLLKISKVKTAETLCNEMKFKEALDLIPFLENFKAEFVLFYAQIYYKIITHYDKVSMKDSLYAINFILPIMYNPEYKVAFSDDDKLRKQFDKFNALDIFQDKFLQSYSNCINLYLKKRKEKNDSLLYSPVLSSFFNKKEIISNFINEADFDLIDKVTFFSLYHPQYSKDIIEIYCGDVNKMVLWNQYKKNILHKEILSYTYFDLSIIAINNKDYSKISKYLSLAKIYLIEMKGIEMLKTLVSSHDAEIKLLYAINKVLIPLESKCKEQKDIEICNEFYIAQLAEDILENDENQIEKRGRELSILMMAPPIFNKPLLEKARVAVELYQERAIKNNLYKCKLDKAVKYVKEFDNEDAEEIFFDASEDIYSELVEAFEESDYPAIIKKELAKLLSACRSVNAEHWLCEEIKDAIVID